MASAARKYVAASTITLPAGETADSRRAFVNPKLATVVQMVQTDDDGNSIQSDIGELPLGTTELYVQHRMCGDFYCYIGGKTDVAAVGATRQEAFSNALAKAA